MKKIMITGIAVLTLASSVFAGSLYWVNPYHRTDGTAVSGHWKTTPDAYKWNNLSY